MLSYTLNLDTPAKEKQITTIKKAMWGELNQSAQLTVLGVLLNGFKEWVWRGVHPLDARDGVLKALQELGYEGPIPEMTWSPNVGGRKGTLITGGIISLMMASGRVETVDINDYQLI